MSRSILRRSFVVALALAACSTTPGATTPDMTVVSPDDPNPDPRCQPINARGTDSAPGECYLPYPSSFYEKADPQTPSGYRVAIPKGVLPRNQVGRDFDPTRLNQRDGFSPSTSLIVNLKAFVDPAQLPKSPLSIADLTRVADSATAASSVQIVDAATGERVPLFAEVDNNVVPSCQSDTNCRGAERCVESACRMACIDDDSCPAGIACGADGLCAVRFDQVLLVHPIARMKPKTRYIAALVGLKDRAGKPITVAPFRALVAGSATSGTPLDAVSARYGEIFTALEKAGVPRAGLTFAWDFVTSSDDEAWSRLLAMRDAGLARWEKDNLGYTIDEVVPGNPDDPGAMLFRLDGTFDVPSFLTSTTDYKAGLKLDDRGRPVDSGQNYKAVLRVFVPKCAKAKVAAGETLPIVLYGHGLLGAALEPSYGGQRLLAATMCPMFVATDWVGLSALDEGFIISNVFSDFHTFSIVTDRLQQAQLNFMVLARLVKRRLTTDKALELDGKRIGDPARLDYFGISQGGIEGGIVVAMSPDISKGAMQVGAGNYSFLLTRSKDFDRFKSIMNLTYPIHRDQALLLATSQNFWDYSDPIGYADRFLKNPFPDPATGKPMTGKQYLYQESRYDAEVPNLGTHLLARAIGLTTLLPSVYPVWGLESKMGPLDSAYAQYDDSPRWTPPPFIPADVNTPATHENDAHEKIREWPALIDQLIRFFKVGGKVEHTCTGPCDASEASEWPKGMR